MRAHIREIYSHGGVGPHAGSQHSEARETHRPENDFVLEELVHPSD
jgi:hypothetical protein